jgi:hypothetical protein
VEDAAAKIEFPDNITAIAKITEKQILALGCLLIVVTPRSSS